MTATQNAKVDYGVETIREWQRGAISWAEAVRRIDVTGRGEAELTQLTRISDEGLIRKSVAAAVATGN